MIDPGSPGHFSERGQGTRVHDLLLGPSNEVPMDVMGRNGRANGVYESFVAVQSKTLTRAANRCPALSPLGPDASNLAVILTAPSKRVRLSIGKRLNQY